MDEVERQQGCELGMGGLKAAAHAQLTGLSLCDC